MSKKVEFKAKDVLGKDFTIVDTCANVKTVNNGMRAILNDLDKYEEKQAKAKKPVTLMDYSDIISTEVIKQTAKLLGLDEADAKKLENTSYSDIFAFYSKAANDFADMEIPTVDKIKQSLTTVSQVDTKKDPK